MSKKRRQTPDNVIGFMTCWILLGSRIQYVRRASQDVEDKTRQPGDEMPAQTRSEPTK